MLTMRRPAGRFTAVAFGVIVCALTAGCSAAIDPAAIADAQTAARVKTALVNDGDLGGHSIEVRVSGGVVTLSGQIRTPAEEVRAVELTRSVTGVTGVRSTLQVGTTAPGPADASSTGGSPPEEGAELQPNPTLLAVGAAVGWSNPRAGSFLTRFAVGPLIKLGSGSGFGPAVGFDWFKANLRSAEADQILSRIEVKPVMVGVGHTLASERVSVSVSVVGGIAFNSLTVTDTGIAAGVPVEVDNSFVWRPGVSAWFDMSRRTALNVSAGYVMTRLRITLLDAGRLARREVSGDTAVVHAGVAYRLF